MISGVSFNKFITYFNLNEISKFSNLKSNLLLTRVEKVSVWLSLDLSLEKSKLFYQSKSIIAFFLIYLITGSYPNIKSSKDSYRLLIESNLYNRDLLSFLEKFFIIYDYEKIEQLIQKSDLEFGSSSFIIQDLSIFSELDGYLELFQFIEYINIDIDYSHDETFRNYLFLDTCIKSSNLI